MGLQDALAPNWLVGNLNENKFHFNSTLILLFFDHLLAMVWCAEPMMDRMSGKKVETADKDFFGQRIRFYFQFMFHPLRRCSSAPDFTTLCPCDAASWWGRPSPALKCKQSFTSSSSNDHHDLVCYLRLLHLQKPMKLSVWLRRTYFKWISN